MNTPTIHLKRSEADIQASVRAAMDSMNQPAATAKSVASIVPPMPVVPLPTYLQNALAQAALGIPIALLPAEQKAAKGAACLGWEESATTDASEIIRRAEANPEMTNYACVAKAIPGGYLFLDDDGGIRAAFEAAGGKMQPTLKNQSCSGNFHYVYRHSAKSLAEWNRIGRPAYISERNPDGKGELWSLRMNNAYIVGPGSRAKNHDGVLGEYKTVHKAQLVEISDALLNFLIDRWKTAESHITSPPQGSERITEGSRNKRLTSKAGTLHRGGATREEIEPILLRMNEELCEPPLPSEEVKSIARSIGRYPARDETVLINGVPAGTSRVTSAAGPGALTQEQMATMTAERAEQESERVRLADEVRKELESRVGPYPKFPLWAIRGTSIFEGLVEPYCQSNSRYEEFLWLPAAIIMLNYLGTKVVVKDKDLIPSIFAVLIGRKGKVIKSSSVQSAVEYFHYAGVLEHGGPSIQDAQAKTLVWTPGSPEGLGMEMQRTKCKNSLLYFDELATLANKAGIENSNMISALLTTYESDKFSNGIKAKKETYSIDPRTYCMSLIACCTDRTFKSLWAKMTGGDTGLNDRFFFLMQPENLKDVTPAIHINIQDGASRTRRLIDRAVSKAVYTIDDSSPLAARLKGEDAWDNRQEIRAEKWALCMAVDLGRDSLDEECIERAIALVEYERAVKKRLRVYETENREANLQKQIITHLEENGGQFNLKELREHLNADRYGTGLWQQCLSGLLASNRIWKFGTGKKGDPVLIRLLRIENPPED